MSTNDGFTLSVPALNSATGKLRGYRFLFESYTGMLRILRNAISTSKTLYAYSTVRPKFSVVKNGGK
jgi:hypothetical protein